MQTVTVHLTEPVFQQIKRLAKARQHSVEDEVVAAIAAALPLSNDDEAQLDQLAFLSDEELERAAQARLSEKERGRMDTLSAKQRGRGLSPVEQEEVDALLNRYDWLILLRAEATRLLKERGRDLTPSYK
ncbi:MAG: hypothetical protein V9G20_28405 [Candidatus Promineifilaceae bacterium]